jgi:hypothetical protein
MDVIISQMKTRATKLCPKILSSLRVEVFRHWTYLHTKGMQNHNMAQNKMQPKPDAHKE